MRKYGEAALKSAIVNLFQDEGWIKVVEPDARKELIAAGMLASLRPLCARSLSDVFCTPEFNVIRGPLIKFLGENLKLVDGKLV